MMVCCSELICRGCDYADTIRETEQKIEGKYAHSFGIQHQNRRKRPFGLE
jgi:hypothetical protein